MKSRRRRAGGANLVPSGFFSNLSPATDPLPQGRHKGVRQEGERWEQLPPQTSDPINGLAWGQAAWPQRPLCPAASPPHRGVRAAPDAKTFRSTKPARQSLGGGPDLSYSFSSPPPPESPNVLSVQPSTIKRVSIVSSGKSRRVSFWIWLSRGGGGGGERWRVEENHRL